MYSSSFFIIIFFLCRNSSSTARTGFVGSHIAEACQARGIPTVTIARASSDLKLSASNQKTADVKKIAC
jgi:hypothetical protein